MPVGLVALLLLVPCALAVAQGDTGVVRDRDAAELRRVAERAVLTFEQRRLRLMPDVAAAGEGRGDVIIGRYRYAAGEAHQVSKLPEEPDELRAHRATLRATLDSAARRLPHDDWVQGRAVWYAIEAGDTTAALEMARACAPGELPWWCDALRGMALHAATRFRDAEDAFDLALAAMPDSMRCRWTDLGVILEGDLRKFIRDHACDARASLDRTVWWLADPFHTNDGNERRSEHFARHTYTTLHDRWRASHPLGWGSDMREMILRYAWPVAWSQDRSRERSATMSGFSFAITGHEPTPAYDYQPSRAAVTAPYESRDGDWDLTRLRGTSHYAHPHARPVVTLPAQFARLLRGDTLLVIAAWDVRDDTLFRSTGRGALALSRDAGDTRHIARTGHTEASGHLRLRVPRGDYVASLEVFAPSRGAARARKGLRDLARRPAISDILVLEAGDTPRSLDAALERVRALTRLRADERRVTLYWEIYGVDASSESRMNMTIDRVHASRARRLAEVLRVAERPQAIAMQWEADAPTTQRAAGSVTVDLGDRTPGIWRITIEVTDAAGRTAVATRDLTVGGR